METLKPCPFCGCRDVHFYGTSDWGQIVCFGCLATFSQQEAVNDDEVREAWNRRAENG